MKHRSIALSALLSVALLFPLGQVVAEDATCCGGTDNGHCNGAECSPPPGAEICCCSGASNDCDCVAADCSHSGGCKNKCGADAGGYYPCGDDGRCDCRTDRTHVMVAAWGAALPTSVPRIYRTGVGRATLTATKRLGTRIHARPRAAKPSIAPARGSQSIWIPPGHPFTAVATSGPVVARDGRGKHRNARERLFRQMLFRQKNAVVGRVPMARRAFAWSNNQ